jgi:F-type H+-transporting ATPase subunit gamma
MGLVASSKIRKATESMNNGKEYSAAFEETVEQLCSYRECEKSPYMNSRDTGRARLVVIAGDRGLAGGYNANVFRMTEGLSRGKDALYLPIGKKAVEYYHHRKADIYTDACEYIADMHVGDTLALAKRICESYRTGEIDSVNLVYTNFVSMITQTPTSVRLLPLGEMENKKNDADPLFEGNPEEILDRIVPDYIGGMLYTAVCESLASESGARRSAMNAANKNASEMIDTLTLSYNRARQSVITQEITEIVSGAEAL